jgi:hypothetical protein
MYYNKRIITLAVALVLLFVGQSLAQTVVLDKFQLGKSTYDQVKANLPKGVQIKQDNGTCEYGGSVLFTEGTGYNINGLLLIKYCFDQKQILAEIRMTFKDKRFNDVNKILISKYRPMRSEHPDVFLLYKAHSDYVYLYLPQDKSFAVDYMTGAVYRRGKLQERQTVEYNKKYERENKKALEREAAEEAEKF